MKNVKLIAILVFGLAVTVPSAHSHAFRFCNLFMQQTPHPSEDDLLKANLLELQRRETEGRKSREVAKMNLEAQRVHESTPVRSSFSGRLTTIPYAAISKVIASMTKNPIIADANAGKYNQPNVDIAYCFGRAAYAHFALLKMGVDKSAIRKIWAVGPMEGDVNWQFHVATIVRADDGRWYVLDTYFAGEVVTLERWISTWRGMNKDGKLRIYFTDPQKFSVELGTYDRVQLGLNLTRDKDWYKGFFADLMTWFQTGSLESVGLTRLIPPKQSPKTALNEDFQPLASDAGVSLKPASENELLARSPEDTRKSNAAQARLDLAAFQKLESEFSRAHRAYLNTRRGTQAEADAKAELKRTSEAMLSSLQFLGSLDYADVGRLAHQAHHKYSTAPGGSDMEILYRRLGEIYVHTFVPAFKTQVERENWSSERLSQVVADFGVQITRSTPGTPMELAYKAAQELASEIAVKAASKESLEYGRAE